MIYGFEFMICPQAQNALQSNDKHSVKSNM